MGNQKGTDMDRTLNITESDLLAELEAMLPTSGNLLRMAEITELLSCSRWKVSKLLHQLKAQGRLIEGETTLPASEVLGGRGGTTVVAYGLKPLLEEP